LETVKQALFDQGAGRYGNYDQCFWQVLGEGGFRPLENSRPFIGKTGIHEKVREYKVEIFCREKEKESILQAFLKVHPYEDPAYHFIPVKK